jgi:diaminopimelate decarboxylase
LVFVLQGDYLAKQIELPATLGSGDILIVHDTGAYTMSMYSKFNSFIPNPVYGFSLKNQQIFCFKERETVADCLAFWGSKQPKLL